MDTMKITATIKVGGVAREVEVHAWGRGDSTEPEVAVLHSVVGTIGRGAARYPTSLTLWRVEDGKRPHPGNEVTTDDAGRVWQYHYGTCIRNRQARIVGWADVAGITNTQDQARA